MKKVTPREENHSPRGWAIVTGATSGIGREYAAALARRGRRVLITGRRREQLESVARSITTETGVEVEAWVVELADTDARAAFLTRVRQCSVVDIVVANAGFGYAEPFVDGPLETATAMIAVHITSVVELFHAVIPAMRRRGAGELVAVTSLASLLPVPGSEVYVATKSYLNSFCESLAVGLSPCGIRVQALLPGFTRTDFHRYDPDFASRKPASRLLHWMKPRAVVDASLAALQRNRVICIPGYRNRLLATLFTLLPRPVMHAIMRRASR